MVFGFANVSLHRARGCTCARSRTMQQGGSRPQEFCRAGVNPLLVRMWLLEVPECGCLHGKHSP